MDHIERHFGCRLRELQYKGMRLLMVENDLIRVSLLLDKGSDIIEFVHKPSDTDFLWHAPWGLRNPWRHVPTSARPEGIFLDIYAGGWQEVLPTAIAGSHLGAHYGDMGEACLLPWNYSVIDDGPERLRLRLSVALVRTPLQLEKTLTLQAGQPVVHVEERLTNDSEVALQVMWGQHPTFGAPFLDEHCVLDVPACNAYTQQYGEYPRLRAGGPQAWPLARGVDGAKVDLSRIAPPSSRTEDMMYLGDFSDGWYAFTNTRQKVGFGMRWSLATHPYLWYWQCFHGPNPQPFFGRAYAVGIEPWTTPPYSLEQAIADGTALRVGLGETIETHFLAVAYHGVERVKAINDRGEITPA